MATNIGYCCVDCEHVWQTATTSCPACGGHHVGRYFGMAVGGSINPSGGLEALADNRHGDVETIQYLATSGTRSDSTVSPSGVELTLRAPLDAGRGGESSVRERVLSQLRQDGRTATLLEGRDDRGEDGALLCDGERITMQIVTVPTASDFYREASLGSASTAVTHQGAATWIEEAVKKKQDKYSPAVRAEMLLAIDARMVGVLSTPAVTTAVSDLYGDLCAKSGFAAIWIIGPSDSRCTRIGSSRL